MKFACIFGAIAAVSAVTVSQPYPYYDTEPVYITTPGGETLMILPRGNPCRFNTECPANHTCINGYCRKYGGGGILPGGPTVPTVPTVPVVPIVAYDRP